MRRRLVVLVTATVAMVTLAFLLPLGVVIQRLAVERAVRPAELATRSLAAVAAVESDDTMQSVIVSLDPDRTLELGIDGAATALGAPLAPDVADTVRQRGTTGRYQVADGLVVAVPVVTDGGVDIVHAHVPARAMRQGVVAAWTVLGGLGLVLLAGSVGLADQLARRTLHSVAELEDTAASLARGDLDARAVIEDPPELAAVGDAMGRLATRISELLQEERETAAGLSHRLRTPLTPLRIEAESVTDQDLRRRLTRLVGRLEEAVSEVVSRTRGGERPATDEITDVSAVVIERMAFWAALAEEEQRTLTVTTTAACVRGVGSQGILDLIDVLVDNVMTHTPDGTSIAVDVAASDHEVNLTVTDDGPGFDVSNQHVGSSGRAGSSGIGLDIARRLAGRANGRLTIDSSVDGTAVSVRMPRVGPTAEPGTPRPGS